jgi:hypothetical protein
VCVVAFFVTVEFLPVGLDWRDTYRPATLAMMPRGSPVTRISVFAIFLGALLTIAPQPAYAYIDPGLGSLLFQSVMAGIIAVGATWAGFKLKIMSFFDRGKNKEKTEIEKR